METSPVGENSQIEIDICTPSENLIKQHCQEITPDNPKQPETKPLSGTKKVPAVGFPPKLSKRKLFGHNVPVPETLITGNDQSSSETVQKKKRSDVTNETSKKTFLTERQQLAFLLEATSMHESAENENDNTFTRIKARKTIKRKGKCVNPRVYRRNERGETPLHIAAIKGDVGTLKKLIKDGADVSVKDYAGWTSLHEACNHGNLEVAKLLVKHGAQVNVPGFEGDTPLHDAVINNHVEVVNILLSYGANPQQTNTKRKTPLDLINSKEMSDVFNLHGVKHTAIENTARKVPSKEPPDSLDSAMNVQTTNLESERSSLVRGSILGNEIQRKETQGESKMEKPVMYICKLEPHNEEVTICTTQVTSYQKCSNVEKDENLERKIKESCEERDQKLDTLRKEVLDIKKNDNESEVPSSNESFTSLHKVSVSSLQAASHFENEDDDGVSVENDQTKSDAYSTNTEELVNQSKMKQSSGNDQNEEDENTNRETSLLSFLSEESAEKFKQRKRSNSNEIQTERSRTPEIDESIALEVLSTGLLSGFSQSHESIQSNIDVHVEDKQSSPYEEQPEGNKQYLVPNDETFLDVESYEPDPKVTPFKENLQKQFLNNKRHSSEPNDRVNEISSTNNKNSDNQNTQKQTALLMKERSNLVDRCSDVNTGISSWNTDDTISQKDGARYESENISKNHVDDFRSWQLEKKARGRKKISVRSSDFTREDKITKRKAEESNISFDNTRSLEDNPRSRLQQKEIYNYQRTKEGIRFNKDLLKQCQPTVTWQSLMAAGRCGLKELRIPGYDQFLMKTKQYELAKDLHHKESVETAVHQASMSKDKESSSKQKATKEELLRKQKSETEKLQLCMEQEILRFYARKTYASLRCNQPPGVCKAIHWQNMSSRQLQNEEKKLLEKLTVEEHQTLSPSHHQEIVEKYKKLQSAMKSRHKHEVQALDAVVNSELQSCLSYN